MKTFFSTLALTVLLPSSAWAAAFCPFPDAKHVKCEIPLCVQAGFPSADGCRPALREFIKRIWKRKSPIPFPTECMCTWFPDVVTPINTGVIPIGYEGSGHFNSTPIEWNGSDGPVLQYAQLSSAPYSPFDKPETQEVWSYTKSAEVEQGLAEAEAKARTEEILKNPNSFLNSTCTSTMFEGLKPGKCYVLSGNRKTDVELQRVMRWEDHGDDRRWYWQYDYFVNAYNVDGTGDSNLTHMQMWDRSWAGRLMRFCRIYQNGVLRSDQNCGIGSLGNIANFGGDDDPEPTPSPFPRDRFEVPGVQRESTPENNGVMVFE